MDGLRGTFQPQRLLEFGQRAVRFAFHFIPEALSLFGFQFCLAPSPVIERRDGSDPLALIQEFFDEAQRHVKALRHRCPRAFASVINRQNPPSQVQRDGFHTPPYRHIFPPMATLLFDML